MKRTLAAVFVVVLAIGCATFGAATPGNDDNPATISWKAVLKDKDSFSIKGSVLASFGRFTFTWRIDATGTITLADEEPSGTGEMPIYEKMILYPWLPGDGKVYLFRIRRPVPGNQDPIALHRIVVVKQAELFAGLAKIVVMRSDRKYPDDLSPLECRAPIEVSEWSAVEIGWEVSGKGQPRLYGSDSSGARIEVFPWMMGSPTDIPSASMVFEITTHNVEDLSLKFLTCRAKVDTAQMLSAR